MSITMIQGAIEDSAYYRRRLREVLREGHAEAAVGIYAGAAFRTLDRLYDPGTWAACGRQETD